MLELNDILTQIAFAEEGELSKIVQAVVKRYDVLFPEEEVHFLSLPAKDRAAQASILRRTAELIEKLK